MQRYGLKNPDGTTNTARKDHVSAVVVSVLQAGAFFGALSSAPISGKHVWINGSVVRASNSLLARKQLVLEERRPYSHSAPSSRSVP